MVERMAAKTDAEYYRIAVGQTDFAAHTDSAGSGSTDDVPDEAENLAG